MTELDLEPIKAREKVATAGPWEAGDRYHLQGASHCKCNQGELIHSGEYSINGEKMEVHLHRSDEPWWKYGITATPLAPDYGPWAVVIETTEYGTMMDYDREFIAHAREDIPALIKEVERLRRISRRPDDE